jgi:hypothetical protein
MFRCSRRFKTTRKKTLSSSKRKARQVFLDHVDPICFLPLVTHLYALILLHIPHTFRIEFNGWVELLSPAVMSYRTSLPSFMMLSLVCVSVESVCLPSVVM